MTCPVPVDSTLSLLIQPTILHCPGIFTRAQLFLTPAALHPVCFPA